MNNRIESNPNQEQYEVGMRVQTNYFPDDKQQIRVIDLERGIVKVDIISKDGKVIRSDDTEMLLRHIRPVDLVAEAEADAHLEKMLNTRPAEDDFARELRGLQNDSLRDINYFKRWATDWDYKADFRQRRLPGWTKEDIETLLMRFSELEQASKFHIGDWVFAKDPDNFFIEDGKFVQITKIDDAKKTVSAVYYFMGQPMGDNLSISFKNIRKITEEEKQGLV